MIHGVESSLELLVPPAPAQATVLLCHFDGSNGATSSTDSSPSAHTLTFHGGAQLTTSAQKFGTASLNLGTGGYITIPSSSDFALTRQWTIEFWLQVQSTLAQQGALITFGNGTEVSGAAIAWQLTYGDIFGDGNLDFQWSVDNDYTDITASSAIPDHTSFHAIALDRDESGVLRFYVGGTMVKKANSFATYLADPASGDLTIGGNQTGAGFLIDELRITNHGARYASDSGYTPSGSAFTS